MLVVVAVSIPRGLLVLGLELQLEKDKKVIRFFSKL